MFLNRVIVIVVLMAVVSSDAYKLEPRGKKKKIAIFLYLADLVVKKFFILKLVYAFVFWVLLHKGWYFFTWFAKILKEKKHEVYYDHHDHHDHYPHYDHHGHDYGHDYHGSSYDPSSYGPYKRTVDYGSSYGPYKRTVDYGSSNSYEPYKMKAHVGKIEGI